MKKLLVIFASLVSGTIVAHAQFKFDGKLYSFEWEAKINASTVREYLCEGETTNTWKTMITLQAHPDAAKVKDVSGPYYEARKSIVSLPPKIHPKKKDDASDAVLELFLGAPGKTAHVEFVLARFIETDPGVYMVVYSHKLPAGTSKDQKIDVDVIMKNKERWIRELLDIPVNSIKQSF